jgi:hypothetical protein
VNSAHTRDASGLSQEVSLRSGVLVSLELIEVEFERAHESSQYLFVSYGKGGRSASVRITPARRVAR